MLFSHKFKSVKLKYIRRILLTSTAQLVKSHLDFLW